MQSLEVPLPRGADTIQTLAWGPTSDVLAAGSWDSNARPFSAYLTSLVSGMAQHRDGYCRTGRETLHCSAAGRLLAVCKHGRSFVMIVVVLVGRFFHFEAAI